VSVQITLLNVLVLPLTILRKCTVHDREFISLFWFIAPAGRDRVPNAVLQPLVLARVCRAGWSFPKSDIGDHISLITIIVWQYSREDLVVTVRLYQVVGWLTVEGRTLKEVIARE
jgi:hypothetical protein